jgi:hypothetical protein
MNTARTPLFYMANLGVEVARLAAARSRGDAAAAGGALARAEAIMSALKAFPEMNPRAAELDALAGAIAERPEDLVTYFQPFTTRALAA